MKKDVCTQTDEGIFSRQACSRSDISIRDHTPFFKTFDNDNFQIPTTLKISKHTSTTNQVHEGKMFEGGSRSRKNAGKLFRPGVVKKVRFSQFQPSTNEVKNVGGEIIDDVLETSHKIWENSKFELSKVYRLKITKLINEANFFGNIARESFSDFTIPFNREKSQDFLAENAIAKTPQKNPRFQCGMSPPKSPILGEKSTQSPPHIREYFYITNPHSSNTISPRRTPSPETWCEVFSDSD